MDKVKIGSFIKEVSEKTTTNNQYILLTSSRSGIVSQQEYFNKQVASKDNTGYKIIKRGQFTYRAMSDTGCFYINRLSNYDVGIVSPAYPVFEITEKKTISGEFLQLFFESNLFQSIIANKSTGSTRLSLKLNKIKDIDIAIPSLDKQKKIVSTIGFISDIISWRKKQIEQLDILLKSRFIEMFGDPQDNTNKYPLASIIDVSTKVTDGEHGTVPRVEIGRLYLMARNITKNNNLDLNEVSYIPEEYHKRIYERCNPEIGDVLLVCVGATIGKATIVPEMDEFSIARSVALIKPDKRKIKSNYLLYSILSNNVQCQIANCSHAAAQAGLYTNMIKNLKIILPPIDIQNQFADFVAQVDKSKLAVQQSLNELETLKKSLMQQYFG